MYSNCSVPITSIGVIAFRKSSEYEKCEEEENKKGECECECDFKNRYEYLMIQRTDSFGYVEFIRGKYSVHNYQYIKNIVDEMTMYEKHNILTKPFDELWSSLWGEYSGIQYRGEEQVSKNKFLHMKSGVEMSSGVRYNLETLISSSTTSWETAEWGFPKGRRNHQEKDLDCGFREFEEETGYDKLSLKQIHNVIPFEEIFIGSNIKSYKNKYYLSYMSRDTIQKNEYQKSEVKNMKWLSYKECMDIIRPYNIEKKNIITSVNNTLNNFMLCDVVL
jgi:ADP-ribose pyrophosphatase YjhB (NUDIX family)